MSPFARLGVCVALLLSGCAASIDPADMTTSYVSLPEGFNLNKNDPVGQILHDERLKSIFATYTDPKSKRELTVDDLGLQVTNYSGTLQPFDGTITMLASANANGSGGIELIRPIVSVSGAAGASQIAVVVVKGHMLRLRPTYTLSLDPSRVILPAGYIQELYYADAFTITSVKSAHVQLKGDGTLSKVIVGGEIKANNVESFFRQYKNALFGKFQLPLENAKVLRESKSLAFSKGAQATFQPGDLNVRIEQVIGDGAEIVISALGREHRIKRGAWAEPQKWSAIWFKSYDANQASVVLELVTLNDEAIRSLGPRVRFLKWGETGTTSVDFEQRRNVLWQHVGGESLRPSEASTAQKALLDAESEAKAQNFARACEILDDAIRQLAARNVPGIPAPTLWLDYAEKAAAKVPDDPTTGSGQKFLVLMKIARLRAEIGEPDKAVALLKSLEFRNTFDTAGSQLYLISSAWQLTMDMEDSKQTDGSFQRELLKVELELLPTGEDKRDYRFGVEMVLAGLSGDTSKIRNPPHHSDFELDVNARLRGAVFLGRYGRQLDALDLIKEQADRLPKPDEKQTRDSFELRMGVAIAFARLGNEELAWQALNIAEKALKDIPTELRPVIPAGMEDRAVGISTSEVAVACRRNSVTRALVMELIRRGLLDEAKRVARTPGSEMDGALPLIEQVLNTEGLPAALAFARDCGVREQDMLGIMSKYYAKEGNFGKVREILAPFIERSMRDLQQPVPFPDNGRVDDFTEGAYGVASMLYRLGLIEEGATFESFALERARLLGPQLLTPRSISMYKRSCDEAKALGYLLAGRPDLLLAARIAASADPTRAALFDCSIASALHELNR